MITPKRCLAATLGFFIILLPFSLYAEALVFATAPTQSASETNKLYGPLLDYLSKVSGQKITLKTASNFVEYSNNMRKGNYDILFDGPHFVGWRMDNIGHEPIARFPGKIRIVVVTKEGTPFKTLEDLASQNICAFASPNMLTMAFLHYFPNPARQPNLIRAQGFDGLKACLANGKGHAMVVRDKIWNKMKDKSGLRLIPVPEHSYPERTFSVSSKVAAEVRAKLTAALTSPEGAQAGQPLLSRFKKDKFLPAEKALYQNTGKLLNPVWGFAY